MSVSILLIFWQQAPISSVLAQPRLYSYFWRHTGWDRRNSKKLFSRAVEIILLIVSEYILKPWFFVVVFFSFFANCLRGRLAPSDVFCKGHLSVSAGGWPLWDKSWCRAWSRWASCSGSSSAQPTAPAHVPTQPLTPSSYFVLLKDSGCRASFPDRAWLFLRLQKGRTTCEPQLLIYFMSGESPFLQNYCKNIQHLVYW